MKRGIPDPEPERLLLECARIERARQESQREWDRFTRALLFLLGAALVVALCCLARLGGWLS